MDDWIYNNIEEKKKIAKMGACQSDIEVKKGKKRQWRVVENENGISTLTNAPLSKVNQH